MGPLMGQARHDRFDIQFMRGVAVLAVVAFHAFPDVFERGFLGVDVFFVVSGFLITTIILKSLVRGDFSFVGFYTRRAKRLLPASLVTLAVTALFAAFILTSSQLADFGEQLVGSLFFAANFVLAGQTGYFEGAAETKPLLHIWSLSLEEQFYFVAPLLLWLTPLRQRPWLLVAGTLASFALCVVLMTGPAWLPFSAKGAQKLAFFMLPTRAWELLAGSLCAWVMLRQPNLNVPAWLKYLALVVIPVVCIVGLDPAHPRLDALIVVLATAVILLGKDGWLPRSKATVPVWHIGNWSYSLYLIHWPLFSFAFIAYGQEPPSWVLIGLAALAVGLAYLQWKHIELRFKEGWPRLKGPIAFAGLAAVLVAAAVPMMVAKSAVADQLRPTQGLAPSCDQDGATWIDKPECQTSPTPTMALWGDSYAMHLVPGLEGVPMVQMTKSACAPVEGLAHVNERYTESWAKECVSFNASVLDALENMPSVRVVVISSAFGLVMTESDQGLYSNGRSGPFSDEGPKALRRTVERIQAMGKTAIVVGPTPQARFNAGVCNERVVEGRIVLGRSSCDIEGSDPWNAPTYAALESSGVEILRPGAVLCASGTCRTREGDSILYQDRGHLTRAGAKAVVEGLGVRTQIAGGES